MTLYLTNTLTRRKAPFKSKELERVKLFTCGPSIYKRPHVGNFATFLFEDVLQRYLEYAGYTVERVINFTDVEDKAVEAAGERGISLSELTAPVAKRFKEEAAILQIRLPRRIPRSSTHVNEAVHLIQILMERGFAYRHGKDVFYDPLKFKGFGKLFRLDMSRWPKKKRRFRKDTYPGQRWNLGDFILWHGYRSGRDERFYWDTPIGKGRPAWNIQDPAIISSKLGYEIDIACGGVDNLYRHHDYTIAIMEAISQRPFARYWLHGEHVFLEGKKMSKSRGNILYLENMTNKGFSAKEIRFYLIYGHYRKKINLTSDEMQKSAVRLKELRETAQKLCRRSGRRNPAFKNAETGRWVEELTGTFEAKMNDDLDVKGAFDGIHATLKKLHAVQREYGLSEKNQKQILRALERIDGVFKVLF
ncbi:MAG: class I tRNA ligase family protein [Deltaproteobacteria bacterium]|nr:class I tRNA ligase family protein [Deltaproteobacteria bacterium]